MTQQELNPNAALERAGELIAALKLHADEKYQNWEPRRLSLSGYTLSTRAGLADLKVGAVTFSCLKADGLKAPYHFECFRTNCMQGSPFAGEAAATEALSWVLMGQDCVCGLCGTPLCEHWGDPRDTSIDKGRVKSYAAVSS